MINITTLYFFIDKELVGTYNFTSDTLAEMFAQGLHGNISDDKKPLLEFKAVRFQVCEDVDDMALLLGRVIGFEDDRIQELINEVLH